MSDLISQKIEERTKGLALLGLILINREELHVVVIVMLEEDNCLILKAVIVRKLSVNFLKFRKVIKISEKKLDIT